MSLVMDLKTKQESQRREHNYKKLSVPYSFFPTRSRTRNPSSLQADQEERTKKINLVLTRSPCRHLSFRSRVPRQKMMQSVSTLLGAEMERRRQPSSSGARGRGGASRRTQRCAPRRGCVRGRGQAQEAAANGCYSAQAAHAGVVLPPPARPPPRRTPGGQEMSTRPPDNQSPPTTQTGDNYNAY